MELIIYNQKITVPIKTIVERLRYESKERYLNLYDVTSTNIVCQCPFHKDGEERHPSCSILNIQDNPELEYGTYHCWSCGASGKLYNLVNFVLGKDKNDEFGKNWLADNYGDVLIDEYDYLQEINLNPIPIRTLNSDILNTFEYDNPHALEYLTEKRRLKKQVVDYFKVGYDITDQSVTFPCWNTDNQLVGIFKRNIYTKRFEIPKINPKPIYLLNEVLNRSYETVVVCESQINALTSYGFGYPAIALFGTGSKEQYEMLNRSGIRNYILCFDGDVAGDNGRKKFLTNIKKDANIITVCIPRGKDLNDLTYEEFKRLPIKY